MARVKVLHAPNRIDTLERLAPSPLWSGSARTAPVASPTIAGAIVLLPQGDPPLSSFDSCRDDLESPVG
ncbi:MAG: hypothetical protein ABSF89_08020 [Acidimicrobiales bacterium]|jgi:hypothetical protein